MKSKTQRVNVQSSKSTLQLFSKIVVSKHARYFDSNNRCTNQTKLDCPLSRKNHSMAISLSLDNNGPPQSKMMC